MIDFTSLRLLIRQLVIEKRNQFHRKVSLGDLILERSEIAALYGFGEGTTCYDSVLILGDVTVGRNTWIGPNVVLDGSGGGLTIGDYCSIDTGVQIYTHDSVRWAVSMGKEPYEKAPTSIGSGVFIGPNSVITKGVTIGDACIIGAMSLVNKSIPARSKAWGQPATVRGEVVVATPVPQPVTQ